MSNLSSPSMPLGDVTIANWRTPPFSQLAFQNVRNIIPCAEIANAPQRFRSLDTQLQSFDSFRVRTGDGTFLNLNEFLAATETDALVIMHDGKIACEYYDHGMTVHSRHILMSASKSIVGLIAGILYCSGVIDLDTLVKDIIPEVSHTPYRGATLRHLLDMRTSVGFDEHQLRAYSAATHWDPVAPGELSTDLRSFFESAAGEASPHGGNFRYVSANTDLLGWAIERATGETFADLVSALLWQPIGSADGAYVTVDRKGLARSTGGICASTRDLARVGQLLLDNGRCGDQVIVPQKWLDDILLGGDRQAWASGEWGQLFAYKSMSYRNGWYVIDDEPKTQFAMGIHGQNLFVDHTNQIVIAKFSSQRIPFDLPVCLLTHRALPEFRSCLIR